MDKKEERVVTEATVVSPSLIRPRPGEDFKYNERFDLGIGAEWMGLPTECVGPDNEDTGTLCCGFEADFFQNIDISVFDCFDNDENVRTEEDPGEVVTDSNGQREKPPLSLKVKRKPFSVLNNYGRYASPCTEEQMMEAARGVVPGNTESSTKWALKNFMEWAENRRLLVPGDVVPENLLECHDAAIVSKYLRMFVLETRKADGTKYTPGSIRSLLSGLNRILKENKAPFSILDDQHPEFRELCKTLDVVSSSLHKEGIGAYQKKAPVIEIDDEDRFWAMELLGYSSPQVLQRTVFYCVL